MTGVIGWLAFPLSSTSRHFLMSQYFVFAFPISSCRRLSSHWHWFKHCDCQSQASHLRDPGTDLCPLKPMWSLTELKLWLGRAIVFAQEALSSGLLIMCFKFREKNRKHWDSKLCKKVRVMSNTWRLSWGKVGMGPQFPSGLVCHKAACRLLFYLQGQGPSPFGN